MPDTEADSVASTAEPTERVEEGTETSGAASKTHWTARLPRQLAVICLAVVAGALSGQLIHYTRDVLPKPEGLGAMPPYPPEVVAAAERVEMGNAAIGFALAGALIGVAVGGGLWVLHRSAGPARRGAILGLLLGAGFGCIGGVITILLDRRLADSEMDDLFRAMLIHSPFWICLGIAVGVAIAVPLRGLSSGHAVGAALGAAVVASLLYPLVSMLLFPASHPDMVIPFELGSRLLCYAMGAGFLAFAAVRLVPSET